MSDEEVKVHIEADYLAVACGLSEDGSAAEHRWEYLGQVLQGRPGWRFTVVDGGDSLSAGWAFGPLPGQSLLWVDAEQEGYRVYDHGPDESHIEPTEAAFRRWLVEREDAAESRGVEALELARTIRRMRDKADGYRDDS